MSSNVSKSELSPQKMSSALLVSSQILLPDLGISFKYQDDVPKPPSCFAKLLGFVHLCMYDLDVIFCSFVHSDSIPVPLEQNCTFEQPLKLTISVLMKSFYWKIRFLLDEGFSVG